jgi:calcineurin-like phosphoesterase family protein
VDVPNDCVMFCSDLHLGHDMAARLRGYYSTAEHDYNIISTLQKQCSKRTVLFVLGDVAMRIESIDFLQNVLGRKKLIRGNHDTFQDGVYKKYFEEVHGFYRYKHMWISHCPIHPQEFYRATANLHGHIHYTATYPQPPFPYINLNWDFWGRAVGLNEIKKWVAEKTVPYELHINSIAGSHRYGEPVPFIPKE